MLPTCSKVFMTNFNVPIENLNSSFMTNFFRSQQLRKKIETMREVSCCPICITKPQQHFGSELFFNFDHCTSTVNHYIHQILNHPIISIHHIRIEHFEPMNSTRMVFNYRLQSNAAIKKDLDLKLELGIIIPTGDSLKVSWYLETLNGDLGESQSYPQHVQSVELGNRGMLHQR